MSFIISILTGEGFVMASDSRTTFTTTTTEVSGAKAVYLGTHISDTAYKTFVTPSHVGISTCGDSTINGRLITGYIETFIKENDNKNVDEIKDCIRDYFRKLKPDLNTTFIICGYMEDAEGKYIPKCYRVDILNNSFEDRSGAPAIWGGEKEVMSRLSSNLYLKKDDGSFIEHSRNEILWQYFTLQDAIDYARYAVQVTIDTMRFQKTVKTVGGPVDILVLKPQESHWIQRKTMK